VFCTVTIHHPVNVLRLPIRVRWVLSGGLLDNSGQKIDIPRVPGEGRVAYRGAARGFRVRLGADPVHFL
jgi:hypothetical protein